MSKCFGNLFRASSLFPCLLLANLFFSAPLLAESASPAAVLSTDADSQFRSAIWVECEGENRPFDTREGFLSYLKFLSGLELTDIYIQIYRNGRSWFPSMLADDSPWREAKRQGFDPIADTLNWAKNRNIRVHAWINTLRVHSNIDAPIFNILGRQVVLVDNYGNSLFDYRKDGSPPKKNFPYKLGTKGLWLEASNPNLPLYLRELSKDLLLKYPDLDGLHLDMVRQPIGRKLRKTKLERLKFGFHPTSVERFKRYLESKDRKKTEPRVWEEWRTALISELVADLKSQAISLNPEIEFSAAVIADANRAQNWVFQNWHSWLGKGILDHVVPMAYSSKYPQFEAFLETMPDESQRDKITIGLGAWMLKSTPQGFKKQMDLVKRKGFAGASLFSFSNLLDKDSIDLLEVYQNSLPN